jgi:hypothetical protein
LPGKDSPECFGHSFDLGARHRFGHAKQCPLGEVGKEAAQRQWPDDVFPEQFGVDQLYRSRQFDDKLVEERSGETAAHTGNFLEF